MRISAKAEYAVAAAVEVAASATEKPLKTEQIANAQGIPLRFLENILAELRHAGIIDSQRGSEGGYQLHRPADEITLAEVIRAVDGPLATVHDKRPESLSYEGSTEPLREVWIALRASIRGILDEITLADIVSGKLPSEIIDLTRLPEAWSSR